MLRDTTSRGLCVRVWPPQESEGCGGYGQSLAFGGHYDRQATARVGTRREGSLGWSLVLPQSLVFGGFAFLPVSLGPAGDCPCKD